MTEVLPREKWFFDVGSVVPCGNEITEHGLEEFPREACGLILVENGEQVYHRCKNLATKPEDQFKMDPLDYAAAEDRGEIVAVAHTHPNGPPNPSDGDRVMCEASGLPWHVVAIHEDLGSLGPVGVGYCEPCGYKPPLVGRPFLFGILDCFTLIKDYYKETLNIDIPEFDRTDGFWDRDEDLYMQGYEKAGFVEVPHVRLHDVILMQIRSKEVANHGAVYIGDTMILHHLYGKLSSRDIYGGYFREATRKFLRHKDLL